MKLTRALKAIGAIVLILAASSAYVRAFTVAGPSMSPTFQYGDFILSNHAAYDFRLPFIDMVLFEISEPRSGDLIMYFDIPKNVVATKRIIGVPGDRISMEKNTLYINGTEATQHDLPRALFDQVPAQNGLGELVVTEKIGDKEHLITYTPNKSPVQTFEAVTVPEGNYFILGDNRDNSADSRYIGLISRAQIKGKVFNGARTLNAYEK